MDNALPQLRHYALLLQLGHTVDYQTYLAREDGAPRLLTLRQARQDRHSVDTSMLERTLAALHVRQRAHLPQVIDFGIEEDMFFWVSDYVEGDTLDSLGRRSLQVPPDVAVRLLLDMAVALDELSTLSGTGPILREDIFIGVDGTARLVPPLTWQSGPRRELHALADSLPHLPAPVVHLCALLWQSISGLTLSSCRDGDQWQPMSALGVSIPQDLERLLLDVLSGRARFAQVRTFASVVEQSSGGVASRAELRQWLLQLIQSRLQGRAHVLRSKVPVKPSAEIPLVRFPADLSAVRLADDALPAEESHETDAPPPLPTIRTPQPFADDSGIEFESLSVPPPSVEGADLSLRVEQVSGRPPSPGGDGPTDVAAESPSPSSIRMSEPEALPAGIPSPVPTSSVRSSGRTLETRAPAEAAAKGGRAPLENALAEYAERLGKNGSSS